MITYPLSNRDAMRTIMARVPTANVTFVDPVIQQFFDDEKNGLCDIEVKRHVTTVMPDDVQHLVRVHYHDPELEFIRALST